MTRPFTAATPCGTRPCICPNCFTTYWVAPAEPFGTAMPASCAVAVVKERRGDKKNLGTIWWEQLHTEMVEREKAKP